MPNKISDILGRVPFARFAIPLLLGIVFGEYIFQYSLAVFWFIGIFGLIYFLLCFYRKNMAYSYRWVWGVLVFLFLFFSGAALWQQQKRTSELPLETKVLLDAVIIDNPVQKPKTLQLKVRIDGYKHEGIWVKGKEKVAIYLQLDNEKDVLWAGQRILITAFLQPIKPSANPEEFSDYSYMQRRGYYTTAFVNNDAFEVLEENALPFYKSFPLKMQQALLTCFKNAGIEGQELAVLMALTIGDKQLLDDEVKQAYSSAGVIHILAVSGLHVGLLYVLLTYLLFFLKGKRYKTILKAVIILFCLWLYAAIAGFSPSVIRAVIMFSFILFAQVLGRQSSTLNAVFASAFFICLFKPLSVFEVGFQLSYLAVLGILAFYPKLSKLIAVKNPILKGVWNICCISFAAQVAVLPFSIFYFHQIPVYFLLANILVIPLVTVATYLIVLLLIVSLVPLLSTIVGYLLSICVWCINYVVAAVHRFPFSVWEDIYLSPLQLMLCLVALLSLMLLISFKKKSLLWLATGCITLTLAIGAAHYIRTGKQNQLVVFSTSNASFVAFIEGHKVVCIRDDKNIEKSFAYNTDGYFIKQQVDRKKICTVAHSKLASTSFTDKVQYYRGLFWFAGYGVKVLTGSEDIAHSKQPFPIDYLIVTNGYRLLPTEALSCYLPEFVVIDSSVSVRKANEWIAILNEKNIPYHNVREEGAFILSM